MKGAFENNAISLKFNNYENASGVRIESMRGAETAFSYLSTDSSSPYIDNRAKLNPAQPETRKYRAIYYDDNENDTLGMWSDEVLVTIP